MKYLLMFLMITAAMGTGCGNSNGVNGTVAPPPLCNPGFCFSSNYGACCPDITPVQCGNRCYNPLLGNEPFNCNPGTVTCF
jgi:hypothetical protein